MHLGCQQSSLDPALFYLKERGHLCGIIVSHIDDFLHAGEAILDVMQKFRRKFLAGRLECGQFRYVGFQMCELKNGIMLDQNEYVKELDTLMITPQRATQKNDQLTSCEYSMLRGLVGKINWVVQGTRPDVSFDMVELNTKFRKGVVGDLQRSIKVIRKLKDEMTQVFFPNLGDSSSWKIVVFTDASLANLCDGVSSMGAHLVFLVGSDNLCCP